MKTLTSGTLGATLIAAWGKLPAIVRYSMVTGLVVFTAAELNIDLNHALRAPSIFRGQAAQGDAQAADPRRTRRDYDAGLPTANASALLSEQIAEIAAKAARAEIENRAQGGDPTQTRINLQAGRPVSGAEALIATDAAGKEAGARKAEIENGAAGMTLAEARRRQAAGLPLTLAQENLLLEVKIKEQKLAQETALAVQREQEARAAQDQADMNIGVAKYTQRMLRGGLPDIGGITLGNVLRGR